MMVHLCLAAVKFAPLANQIHPISRRGPDSRVKKSAYRPNFVVLHLVDMAANRKVYRHGQNLNLFHSSFIA